MLAPEGALDIHEKAWNAFPFCRTGEFSGLSSSSALPGLLGLLEAPQSGQWEPGLGRRASRGGLSSWISKLQATFHQELLKGMEPVSRAGRTWVCLEAAALLLTGRLTSAPALWGVLGL